MIVSLHCFSLAALRWLGTGRLCLLFYKFAPDVIMLMVLRCKLVKFSNLSKRNTQWI